VFTFSSLLQQWLKDKELDHKLSHFPRFFHPYFNYLYSLEHLSSFLLKLARVLKKFAVKAMFKRIDKIGKSSNAKEPSPSAFYNLGFFTLIRIQPPF